MKISLSVPIENTVTNHGYGVAAQGMVLALVELGHSVALADETAPVEIAFCQPYLWEWSNPDAYHIGYVPWESTRIPDGWYEMMQSADEIWTTSEWCKTMYEKNGLENVRVYQHGVDTGPEGWQRKHRRPADRPGGSEIRFLHIGEPAPRKSGQLVFDTFTELYGDSKDVSLTIKAHGYNTIRGNKPDNVKVYAEELPTHELIDMVRRHDVLLYPSWGEGFGLIPLQAMATGMPVVLTTAWAPYANLTIPELRIPSKLVPSPWPGVHPGNMYEPNEDALRAAMMLSGDPREFPVLAARAYQLSFAVETLYDWTRLTQRAFAHILERFSETV